MKSGRQLASVALSLAIFALLAGCASTGVPLPPSLELPKPVTDLRVVRKGDRVYLAWTVPTETTDRRAIRRPGPTSICRTQQAAMSECGGPVGELPTLSAPVAVSRSDSGKAPQKIQSVYSDTLPPELLQSNSPGILTYSVEVLNANRRSAGLSNRVQVSSAATLPPPTDFKAQVTGDGVILTWKSSPGGQEDRTLHHVYRVYRRAAGSTTDTIAGEVPLGPSPEVRLADHSFDWDKSYQYRATVVTLVSEPDKPEIQVEGEDTAVVDVLTRDVFPPATPSGLQAVFSGVGQQPFIDLIWSPITDADLAGYNVYRHEEGTPPAKINTTLIKAPAYRDSGVLPGRNYSYAVTSLDVRGNESAPSEETNEQVP